MVTKNKTIATAESCTGGLLAAALVEYPGVSKVFLDGTVTYSDEAKRQRLGVKKETLDQFGASALSSHGNGRRCGKNWAVHWYFHNGDCRPVVAQRKTVGWFMWGFL